jgi:hypothetical protein
MKLAPISKSLPAIESEHQFPASALSQEWLPPQSNSRQSRGASLFRAALRKNSIA